MFIGYEILETLHKGARSVVFRAAAKESGVPVIIKTLVSDFPKPSDIERLKHEYEIYLQLKNSYGIPQAGCIHGIDGRFAIVLPDIGCISLRKYVKSKEVSVDEYLRIFMEVSSTLATIHARQIIHRDITPDNILIEPNSGLIQIIDFGLSISSKFIDSENVSLPVYDSSLPYIAPELTGRMNRPVDNRSDLYSLGIVMFEAATGRLPFDAKLPLEWVHAHLAQVAPDPRTFKPNLPEVIVNIISILISKMAEKRYQSAFSLQRDLKKCYSYLQEKGTVEAFELSVGDSLGLFFPSLKLYGREEQLVELANAVKLNLNERKASFVLVTGYSGIGKTSLVLEAQRDILKTKGYFISGKFDQLIGGIPYYGFSMAFANLVTQVLALKEAELKQLKIKIIAALGPNAQIINQLVPDFEKVIGLHPPPSLLLPEESSNRFLQTLVTFVKTVATPDTPLVLFLDDMQWADVASINLLELLLSDSDPACICIIGSYRNNEVEPGHPLALALQKISEVFDVKKIVLTNLELQDVRSMLADTFKLPYDNTYELAHLLISKTEGNPFFLTQTLRNLCDNGLIYFDVNDTVWKWRIEEIKALDITDNVVTLMVSKIQRLSSECQHVLQLASCIGNEFTLKALAIIANIDYVSSLNQAIEQGLVINKDDNYIVLSDRTLLEETFYLPNHPNYGAVNAGFRFLHDKVQQAAYQMISKEDCQQVHLTLGQNLSRHSNEEIRNDEIFTICNHLNKAKRLIKSQEERMELAALNLHAARKARNAKAYVYALEHATSGAAMLDAASMFNQNYLWKALYHEVAQCNYLLGNTTIADQVYQQLLKHSTCRMDKLQVYRAYVDMHSALGNHKEVKETVAEALKQFHINIPRFALETRLRIIGNLIEIKWGLRDKEIDEMVHAPRCKSADQIKLAELLLEAGPSIYLSDQSLFAWLILFEVRMSLRHGNTPSSAMGYTGYGMIMNTLFGNVDIAFRMAEMGEKLNNEFGNPFPLHKLRFVKLNFISHLRVDVKTYLDDFYKLAKMALSSGDKLYLGLNYFAIFSYRCALGHSIAEVLKETQGHIEQLKSLNNYFASGLIVSRYNVLRELSGKNDENANNENEIQILHESISTFKKDLAFTNLAVLYSGIYQAHFLLDKHKDEIVNYILEGNKCSHFINGTFHYVDFAIYQGLCIVKIYDSLSFLDKRKMRGILNANCNVLKNRAKKGAVNYELFFGFVNVLELSVEGNSNDVINDLEELLPSLEQKGFIHLHAISKEMLAVHYHNANKQKVASVYLMESMRLFERWGALAKLQRMRQQYDFLETALFRSALDNKDEIGVESASFSVNSGLDLVSLIKASTAISGEIVLNKLLPVMISIVVENAGAHIGFLITESNGELKVTASKKANREEAELLNDIPLEECHDVAQSIIQYAYRTLEVVLLDNAGIDERFKNDEHIKNLKTKSILCIPFLHQGVFRGVVYLENNLISHAFTMERVNVLKILCAQIAVSLDNALLYRNLEQSLNNQLLLTEAYSRFTPKEYLRFLGHTSILDVKLGDHRIENLTVLFADIRSYTSLAEQFTAEENFLFLSDYLEQVTGVIAKHKGMVNQLLGDGVLAFFDKPDEALEAAIDIQTLMRDYKVQTKKLGHVSIKAGIGLHTGEVIIGIMGNTVSMDTGIVSDTVNVAARIEGLTKHFGVSILMSEAVIIELKNITPGLTRYVGRVMLKGKKQDVGLYECFQSDSDEERTKKTAILQPYHHALELYCTKEFAKAAVEFGKLAQESENDLLIAYYYQKSLELSSTEIPTEWDAIEIMEMK